MQAGMGSLRQDQGRLFDFADGSLRDPSASLRMTTKNGEPKLPK